MLVRVASVTKLLNKRKGYIAQLSLFCPLLFYISYRFNFWYIAQQDGNGKFYLRRKLARITVTRKKN